MIPAHVASLAWFMCAGPSAVFGFPETRLGIIPGEQHTAACTCQKAQTAGHESLRVERFLRASSGAGGTQRLPRIVGRTAAKELIFTGRRINGTDALRLGLVDHLAAEGQSAEDRALQLARDIAQVAYLRKSEHLTNSLWRIWLDQGLAWLAGRAHCAQDGEGSH